MTWLCPDDERQYLARRLRRCADEVDTSRNKMRWVLLSLRPNLSEEVAGQDLDGTASQESLGARFDRLAGETDVAIERLDALFDALRSLERQVEQSGAD